MTALPCRHEVALSRPTVWSHTLQAQTPGLLIPPVAVSSGAYNILVCTAVDLEYY